MSAPCAICSRVALTQVRQPDPEQINRLSRYRQPGVTGSCRKQGLLRVVLRRSDGQLKGKLLRLVEEPLAVLRPPVGFKLRVPGGRRIRGAGPARFDFPN